MQTTASIGFVTSLKVISRFVTLSKRKAERVEFNMLLIKMITIIAGTPYFGIRNKASMVRVIESIIL